MHNNHFEAIALTQKLAFSLTHKDFAAADVAVLPPFTALRSVQTLIEGDKLQLGYGAQDISPHDDGAYTGEVSGRMLAKLGCRYVLAGHSERRQYHDEDDALVNAKVKAALRAGMTPDPVRRRAAGSPRRRAATSSTPSASWTAAWTASPASRWPAWSSPMSRSGRSAPARWPPRRTRRRCARLSGAAFPPFTGTRVAASARILYGGSVKPDNMPAIMAQPDIDGALVGGASLDAGEFVRICRYRELIADTR